MEKAVSLNRKTYEKGLLARERELEEKVTEIQLRIGQAEGAMQSWSLRLGERSTYIFLTQTEGVPEKGSPSIHSPLGQAILGKKAGEGAVVLTPQGEQKVKILKILR